MSNDIEIPALPAKLVSYATALKVPPWTLLVPGLAKHPELLTEGALDPLAKVVESYLGGRPDKRANIERAAAQLAGTKLNTSLAVNIDELNERVHRAFAVLECLHWACDPPDGYTDVEQVIDFKPVHRTIGVVQDMPREIQDQLDDMQDKVKPEVAPA